MSLPKLAPTNEILTAFLSEHLGDETQDFKNDATGFIKEKFDLDLKPYDVSVVENSSKQIHLILPYYTIVEKVRDYLAAEHQKAANKEETLHLGESIPAEEGSPIHQ